MYFFLENYAQNIKSQTRTKSNKRSKRKQKNNVKYETNSDLNSFPFLYKLFIIKYLVAVKLSFSLLLINNYNYFEYLKPIYICLSIA